MPDNTNNPNRKNNNLLEVIKDLRQRIYRLENVPEVTGLSFGTGWTNFGTGYENAGFYKIKNRVYLVGAVKRTSGAAWIVGTLPVGYRPPGTYACLSNAFAVTGDAVATLSISTTGVITLTNQGAALGQTFTSLENISFRV